MKFRPRGDSALGEDIGLALGVVGFIALLGGFLLYGLIPEIRSWSLGLLWASLGSFVASAVLARRLIGGFISTRRGRYGLNTIVMVAAFVALLGLFNFLSASVNLRKDLTATNLFTLSSQTRVVLDGLTEPVEAYAFFTASGEGRGAAENLLREYGFASSEFSYRMVDPETDPATAARFQVDQNGLVVFASAQRVSRTVELTEQSFTSTLLRATGQSLSTVCFLTGHGERSIIGTNDAGLNQAARALEQELYLVRDFALSSSGGVPTECTVLLIVGPDREITAEDSVLVRQYLGGGGNAVFLIGPEAHPTWFEILEGAGIIAGGGTIIDQASFVRPDPATPSIRTDQYLQSPGFRHPITGPLIERSLITFFPLATRMAPVAREQQFPDAIILPLIFSSERSWLDADLQDPQSAAFDQASDQFGPIAIMTATEIPTVDDTSRIVAIGNAAFIGNQFFASLGNGDLFLNSVNWATDQEALISIRPKINAPRVFIIGQREWSWILYSSVGVLPGLISLVGAWTWWRRR